MARRTGSPVRALALLVLVASITGMTGVAPAQTFGRFEVPNPEPGRFRLFGGSAAGLGQNLVIGAPGIPTRDPSDPGRVHVIDASTGASIRTIANPTPAGGDEFGASVAAVGANVLVGAPSDDTVATNVGAAYLFDGATGALLRTFTDPAWAGSFSCGRQVAAVGGSVLVSCPGDAAYLFDAATGALLQTFTVPGPNDFPRAIAALGGDVLGSSDDAVYRFDGATGAVLQTYPDPTPGDGDFFGASLATVGGNVLTGLGIGGDGNEAYLFDSATGTLLHAFVKPSVNFTSDWFGSSVAGVGPYAVIGSSYAIFVYDTANFALVDTFLRPRFRDFMGPDVASYDGGFVTRWSPHRAPPASGGVIVFDVCGNGTRSDGEACDDGNIAGGDGCSATCRLEACPPAPASGCRATTGPGKSRLDLFDENSLFGEKDRLKWKWKGQATALGDFGDPTATASYALCVYDRAATTPRQRMNLGVPPGGSCAGRTCWATSSTKLRYRDVAATPAGLTSVDLRAGGDGSASIAVKGLGPALEVPKPVLGSGVIPLDGVVVAQLHNTQTGVCWSAEYPTPLRNANNRYAARNP